MTLRAFLPDLLVSGARVLEGAALSVRDGRVAAVGAPAAGAELVRLPGTALLPGLVTAHSHAFQRAIRGRTEYRAHPVDDFWTWREAMYAAAERLSPDDLYAVSKMCFLEMARAGITCVGEFHYLHRDPQGRPYADPNELDLQVLRAAREVGLRVVLLRVAYARAGYQITENPRQRRFIESSADEYLQNLHALSRAGRGDPLVSVGAAPHSVRACPAPWIEQIAREAAAQGWPLHLHVSEQPAEVKQCRAEHGLTPPLLLEKLGALGPRTTAVHAVHLGEQDIAALGRAAATVCACPTTERNLGDGVVRADLLLAAGAHLSLGSDSEVQLAPLEDARALEYHLRLNLLQRAVLAPGEGPIDSLGARLYQVASAGGMRSLGLAGGSLAVGEPADFLVADLDDPSIAGASAADLLASAVFSLERTAIREVRVAGEPVVREGRTGQEAQVLPAFRAALKRLWS
jgi:formimidoylglutamate deiminase